MFESYKNAEEFKKENGYDIDGQWYPRVTRLVSIKAKPALYYYYAQANNFRAAKQSLENAAREGTLIHDAAEALLLGKTPEIDPIIAPSIAAFKDFMEENEIVTKPEYIERRIMSTEHRYAGTIDALATIDGKFGVLDIKTSRGIYRDYDLQTAAYMAALEPEFPEITTRWIMRIDQTQSCGRCNAIRRTKGGVVKVRRNGYGFTCGNESHDWQEAKGEVELKEIPHRLTDFEAFLGAKRLWEWENEKWLGEIGYLA